MFHRIPILSLLFPALMLLAGCGAGKRTAAADQEGAKLLERLRQSYQSTPLLTIDGTMIVSGATIAFDAILKERDSLKINLVGPFAVPVGALSATPEAFLFFNALEGEVVEGRPDRRTFGELMRLDMGYDEMASMLRGELPRIPEPGGFTTTVVDGLYHYTVPGGGTIERFVIDPADLAVTEYSRSRDSGGDRPFVEIAIDFKRFYTLGERKFPREAYVEINNNEQSVAIKIEKVRDQIDAGRSFALDIPAGIPRRRL